MPTLPSLDIEIRYGATYGPRFSTAILKQSDRQEQRRAMWSQPLVLANLSAESVNNAQLEYLLDFHASVKGAYGVFRLRDWSDYYAVNQPLGIGNGTVQQWQLVKVYRIGDYAVKRPITKPIASTVKIYANGVRQNSAWTIDDETGLVETELSGTLTADFDFDFPARFEQDRIDFEFNALDRGTGRKLFRLNNLTCTEVRTEPAIYPPLDPLPDLLPRFAINVDYGTAGGPTFETAIAATASEFEDRRNYRGESLGEWNIGGRSLNRAEADYWIAMFRLARGMAVPFQFWDWQTESLRVTRFAEDRMTLRFDVDRSDREAIFNLGGLAVKEIPPNDFAVCGLEPYLITLGVPFGASVPPRETATTTFPTRDFLGDRLPVSSFSLDDFAFVVSPDHDIFEGYTFSGGTRTIALPDRCLLLYDGDNPDYADGAIEDTFVNVFIYREQSYTIPANTSLLLADAIAELIAIGVPIQAHNALRLSSLRSQGFVDAQEDAAFKLMHITSGGGSVSLAIAVPQC